MPDVDVSFYAVWRVFTVKKSYCLLTFHLEEKENNIFNSYYCIKMTSVKMFYSSGFGPRTILRSIGDLPWPHLIWFACQRELCNWHLCRTKKDQLTEKKGFSCRTVCLSLFSAAVCCLWLATDRRETTVVCLCSYYTHAWSFFFCISARRVGAWPCTWGNLLEAHQNFHIRYLRFVKHLTLLQILQSSPKPLFCECKWLKLRHI